MWGATKDGEGLGEISAAQQHKGTSEELLNLAEMKGIGRAESLQQWDIKTDNKQNKTQHVLMKKYACWHRSNMRDMAAWLERGVASYRAVEHALAIHGNVKATLHPLDGHHSQTHRNKIKQGCRADRVEEKQTVTKRQRRKRDIRHKGQNRTIEFSLNSCRHNTLWSLFFGCLSAVKWIVQDIDKGNSDASDAQWRIKAGIQNFFNDI